MGTTGCIDTLRPLVRPLLRSDVTAIAQGLRVDLQPEVPFWSWCLTKYYATYLCDSGEGQLTQFLQSVDKMRLDLRRCGWEGGKGKEGRR